MPYSSFMYEKAQKTINIRRKEAIQQQNLRKQEIYSAIPQIQKIDKLISKTSIDVSKEILSFNSNKSNKSSFEEILQGGAL